MAVDFGQMETRLPLASESHRRRSDSFGQFTKVAARKILAKGVA
jgi:hypothetical protein